MTYEVIISPTAFKDLKRFDKELQRIFFGKIEKLAEYPYIFCKPLRKPLAGKWELRFEKRWRIIYTISEIEKNVQIVAIWHKDEF